MKLFKNIIRIVLIGSICFMIFVIADSWLFDIWTRGNQLVTQPNDEVLATAEYLYLNLAPTPDEFYSGWYRYSPDETIFCTTLYGRNDRWTRLFLNNELVPREYIYNPLWLGTYRQFDPVTIFCLQPDAEHSLSVGLHLLEIQYKNTPFDAGITYQQAIMVEPTQISLIQPQYVLQTYQNDQNHACIDISANQFEFRDIQNINFRMFANDNPINMADIYQSIIASFDPIWTVCIDPIALSAGENRLEIRFKPLDTPVISYRWVVNMDG